MDQAVRLRARRAVSSGHHSRLCTYEALENRLLLHAAIHHLMPDLAHLASPDGHIAASDFLKARPEFVGRDIWDPATFNPTNSPDATKWLFDPHFIEDDISSYTFPAGAPDGGEGGAGSLPDLVPITSSGYLQPFLDTTEIPGRNLLRFTTGIGNMGAGPNILISANSGTPPAGSGITSWINSDGSQNVLQQIYTYNPGSNSFTFSHYRPAGRMVWHAGHGHFHLEGYAEYRLLTNVGGQPGPVAMRSDGAPAISDKIGFCMINTDGSFVMPTGQSSSILPGWNAGGQPGTGCGFIQGIHVGKGDTYSSIYDGQWVDVTGVPNGNYFLEVRIDALNVIQESNEDNNVFIRAVTLNANPPVGGIQPDRFEPNNTFEEATDLGVLGQQTQSGLTIHTTNENDYFKFVAASSGNYQVRLNIGDRDVNLYLYDAQQTLLASSTSPSSGGSETVSRNFVAGQTYYVLAKGFGTATGTSGVSSNYALQVMVNPTVNATAPVPVGNEFGPVSGMISLGRNGPVSGPLTVNFTVAGTATRGVDYEIYQDNMLITGNSVVIGVESSAAELEIRPIYDNTPEPSETVLITLGTSSAYVVGGGTAATVTISDAGPEVTQTTQVWQTSPHKLLFNLARADAATLDLSDFAILNRDTNQPVNPQAFNVQQNGDNATATITFNGVLPDGRYRATLTGAGVASPLGDVMFGSFEHDFFVLTGDANHDGRINLADFNILAENFGQSGRDASTGDFTYDGLVNLADFNVLASKFGMVIPSGDSGRGASSGASPFSTGRGIGGDSQGEDSKDRLDELA